MPSLKLQTPTNDQREKALLAVGQDMHRLVQANPLIDACYSLSLIQMRLFVYTLSRLDISSGQIDPIEIDYKVFCDYCGVKVNYARFLAEADALDTVKVHISHRAITNDNTGIKTGIFRRTSHSEGVGKIWLIVDEFILPYLVDLRRNFTVLDAREYIRLSSFYAMRFYQFCRKCESYTSSLSNQSVSTFRISVDQLREQLGMGTKLLNYTHFKQNVLEPVRKELDKDSDLVFTYTEVRGPRNKVIELHFTVSRVRESRTSLRLRRVGDAFVAGLPSPGQEAGEGSSPDEITDFSAFSGTDSLTDAMQTFDPKLYRKLNKAGIGPDTIQLWVMRYGQGAIEAAFRAVCTHPQLDILLNKATMFRLMERQLEGADLGKSAPVAIAERGGGPPRPIRIRSESSKTGTGGVAESKQLDLSFQAQEKNRLLDEWVNRHMVRRPDYLRAFVNHLYERNHRTQVSTLTQGAWECLLASLKGPAITITESTLEELSGNAFLNALRTDLSFYGQFSNFLKDKVEREGIMDFPF